MKESQNFDVPRTVQKQDASPDKGSPPLYVMAPPPPGLHTERAATTGTIVGHTAKAVQNTSRLRNGDIVVAIILSTSLSLLVVAPQWATPDQKVYAISADAAAWH
jgi:hypothetical protein